MTETDREFVERWCKSRGWTVTSRLHDGLWWLYLDARYEAECFTAGGLDECYSAARKLIERRVGLLVRASL